MGAPDLRDMHRNPARTYAGEAPYGSMDPANGSHCSTPSTSTSRSCTRRSDCSGRPRSPILRCRRPTRRRTTGGSASSAPTSRRPSCRRRTCRSPTLTPGGGPAPTLSVRPRPERRAATSPRSPTTANHWAIPTTTRVRRRAGPRRAVPRHPRSSRSGRRAPDGDVGARQAVAVARRTVQASDGVRHQFTTLFDYGVFDRFADLRVLVLESGGGWIGSWLDRLDAVVWAHVHR